GSGRADVPMPLTISLTVPSPPAAMTRPQPCATACAASRWASPGWVVGARTTEPLALDSRNFRSRCDFSPRAAGLKMTKDLFISERCVSLGEEFQETKLELAERRTLKAL